MLIDTLTLAKDEQVYLEMQRLFETEGYRKFKMRKFEEYSLYLENKNFLGSESVITFNDPTGKLLALKPDVTLSIVKSARASENEEEKVYYRENVYRLDKQSGEFKEIDQIGLEFIGEIQVADTVKICELAIKSLEIIDGNFIFAVSHMGYITAILDSLNIESEKAKKKILACFKNKNAHELKAITCAYKIDKAMLLEKLVQAPTSFMEALALAKECAVGIIDAEVAVAELEAIDKAFASTEYAGKIRLDFSILNDIDYYNGIIFQGFTAGIPRMLLSGGRYDRLLEKFKKRVGAMGFALSLSELNLFCPKN